MIDRKAIYAFNIFVPNVYDCNVFTLDAIYKEIDKLIQKRLDLDPWLEPRGVTPVIKVFTVDYKQNIGNTETVVEKYCKIRGYSCSVTPISYSANNNVTERIKSAVQSSTTKSKLSNTGGYNTAIFVSVDGKHHPAYNLYNLYEFNNENRTTTYTQYKFTGNVTGGK